MEKGFTLIEILLVLTIVVILAGGVVASLSFYQPYLKLRGVARDLITDLRYAQQLAVTEQINHSVKFFPTQKKYQIIQEGPVLLLSERILPEEVSFGNIIGFTDNKVVFNPYGASGEAGSIVLQNTEGKTMTIEVKLSGFVKSPN